MDPIAHSSKYQLRRSDPSRSRTKPPHFWQLLELKNALIPTLVDQAIQAGVHLSQLDESLLRDLPSKTRSHPRTVRLAKISVRELGFQEETPFAVVMQKLPKRQSAASCPADTGFYLGIQLARTRAPAGTYLILSPPLSREKGEARYLQLSKSSRLRGNILELALLTPTTLLSPTLFLVYGV